MQRIQEQCGTYSWPVSSDLRSIEEVMKDALVAFASAGGDEASLANL